MKRIQAEVLNSAQPVLVDFTAAWCGPCKMLDPVVKQLAQRTGMGKVKIVKLDVDRNPNLAMQYRVLGMPTLLLFVNGQRKPACQWLPAQGSPGGKVWVVH